MDDSRGETRETIVVDLTAEISMLAARVSIECRLPMAESVILATSRVHGASIWTQDSDFEEIEGPIRRKEERISESRPLERSNGEQEGWITLFNP